VSAYDLEAVQGAPQSSSAAGSQDQSADLAFSVRRLDRRAGWCKSPCPDLVRAPVGKRPGLLYTSVTCGSMHWRSPPHFGHARWSIAVDTQIANVLFEHGDRERCPRRVVDRVSLNLEGGLVMPGGPPTSPAPSVGRARIARPAGRGHLSSDRTQRAVADADEAASPPLSRTAPDGDQAGSCRRRAQARSRSTTVCSAARSSRSFGACKLGWGAHAETSLCSAGSNPRDASPLVCKALVSTSRLIVFSDHQIRSENPFPKFLSALRAE
jgi:hypothetical protein